MKQIEAVGKESLDTGFFYISSLDGIRCIAVIYVLLLHCSYGILSGGWIGVDLFFVLSGFLITSLLRNEFIRTGKIRLFNFWIRRGLKLLPPLLVTIILTNILWIYLPANMDANRFIASTSALFYFANFINPKLLGPLSHMWSLSVEEHFYLFWPLAMGLLILRKNRESGKSILIILLLIVSIIRLFGYLYLKYSVDKIFDFDPYRSTVFRLDSILFGCFLGLYTNNKNKIHKTTGIILNVIAGVFLILSLLLFDQSSKWIHNGGFVLINLFCMLIVYIAIKQPNHIFLSNKICSFIGKRSYGIYLYHFPIFLFLENLRKEHDMVNFIEVTCLRFFVSILIATISYRYIESPILKLKKRFSVT
ncbi:MAG: acyltransferase [Bacteroidetes bacterium]|nr:acyltransferase [Bacteroidota bacterium]